MKHKLHYILAAALAFAVQSAALAQQNELTYSLGDAEVEYGTGGKNAETYDVALRLNDAGLVGLQVKAVQIAFPSTDNLSNARAWLTKELPAISSSKMGTPDITTKAFDIATDFTEVVFDEPYTITDEGVYVGYSFDVAKVTTAARPVLTTRYTSPDGFYIHTTKIYRTAWRSLYPNAGQLAIKVVLAGEGVKGNAAVVSYVPEINVKTGEVTPITFEVTNQGNKGISSIDYSYEVAGQTYNGHADISVPAVYGRVADVATQLPAISEKGSYNLNITINSVNGQPNEATDASLSAIVSAYNIIPKHRAVLEEYTGTWCGYCPRGFVGLEEMNRLFPDDFIGISYHNGDPMEITSDFPSNVTGFPDAWIDRYYQTDAYCGDSEYGLFGIDKTWQQCCEVFAPANVDVESTWTDDNTLTATAFVTFPVDRDDCPYEVGFVLTHDGMTGTESGWTQANYYSGETGWPASMDMFTEGSSKMSGLVFNDVLVARSGKAGIEGSLSAPIEADVAKECTYAFNMDQVVNTSGSSLVQDKSKLRVIALLIEKESGRIINANKAMAGQSSTTTGIDQPATSAEEVVVATVYYDLQGRRISMPQNGLFIKCQTLKNGQVRVVKTRK